MELNVEIQDAGFAADMEQIFEHDLTNAVEITAEQWHRRPWYVRLGELILRPLARCSDRRQKAKGKGGGGGGGAGGQNRFSVLWFSVLWFSVLRFLVLWFCSSVVLRFCGSRPSRHALHQHLGDRRKVASALLRRGCRVG